jgi:hypothetical protein
MTDVFDLCPRGVAIDAMPLPASASRSIFIARLLIVAVVSRVCTFRIGDHESSL